MEGPVIKFFVEEGLLSFTPSYGIMYKLLIKLKQQKRFKYVNYGLR